MECKTGCLREEERLEYLGGGLNAIVSAQAGFGTDAVLLAHFSMLWARPAAGGKVCDLGTGCGIIPLLWRLRCQGLETDAFEIEPAAADQAARAMALNGLDVRVFCRDFRTLDRAFYGRYDLVACNPPYLPESGRRCASPPRQTARHEGMCTIAQAVEAASKLLRTGGRLCICQRPARLAELLTSMRERGVEPKRMRFVQANFQKAPWLALVLGKKGAKPGLTVDPVLVATSCGEPSGEMREIYGEYQKTEERPK